MFESIITISLLSIIFIIKACIQNKRRKPSEWDQVRIITPTPSTPKKPQQKPTEAPKKPVKPSKRPSNKPSPDTIRALHKQADAERAIAEALEHKAQHITDPVKRARIDNQAATSWLRFNQILDRIDQASQ